MKSDTWNPRQRWMPLGWFCLLAVSSVLRAAGQEPAAEPGADPALPMADSYAFFKSLAALAFVLGLIFLAAYLFKRVTGLAAPGGGVHRVPIRLVGHMPLGNKKFLAVVETGGKHYFLGVCPDSVHLLADMGGAPVDTDPEPGTPDASDGTFGTMLKRAGALLAGRRGTAK